MTRVLRAVAALSFAAFVPAIANAQTPAASPVTLVLLGTSHGHFPFQKRIIGFQNLFATVGTLLFRRTISSLEDDVSLCLNSGTCLLPEPPARVRAYNFSRSSHPLHVR